MIAVSEQHTPAAQMVATADSRLSELEAHVSELDGQQSHAQDELATIAAARHARQVALAEAREHQQSKSIAQKQASSYAGLAQRTANERSAVAQASAAKKEALAAQKTLDRLVREDKEASQVADAREQELHKQLQMLQSEREAKQSESETIMHGRKQAHAELGAERYEAIVAQYQALAAKVEALKSQLVEAHVQAYDFHQNALQELTRWPDLQKEVAARVPVDDPTSRVIQATLLYMQALLDDGPDVRLGIPTPWELRNTLYVREGAMFSPGALAEQKRQLEQVLDAYRELSANEESSKRIAAADGSTMHFQFGQPV